MELRQLELFLAVVDYGGFQAAAERAYCSQSTVSEAIKRLERSLEAELFDRRLRPAKLTPAGEILAKDARELLGLASEAQERVKTDSKTIGGEVRLGTYPSVTSNFLTKLLPAFEERYPEIQVTVVELGGLQLPRLSEQGQVDCFIRQNAPPLSGSLFEVYPLWREPLFVVLPAGHSLQAEAGPLDVKDLVEHRLIVTGLYRRDGLSAHGFWSTMGDVPNVAYEVSHPKSLVSLVRAGLGVGITTLLGIRTGDMEGVGLKRIDDPTAVNDVSLYIPRLRSANRPLRIFMDFVVSFPVPEGCTPLTGGEAGTEGKL